MIFFFQKSKLQKFKNFDPLFQIAGIEFFEFFVSNRMEKLCLCNHGKYCNIWNTSMETASKTVIGDIYFETDFS